MLHFVVCLHLRCSFLFVKATAEALFPNNLILNVFTHISMYLCSFNGAATHFEQWTGKHNQIVWLYVLPYMAAVFTDPTSPSMVIVCSLSCLILLAAPPMFTTGFFTIHSLSTLNKFELVIFGSMQRVKTLMDVVAVDIIGSSIDLSTISKARRNFWQSPVIQQACQQCVQVLSTIVNCTMFGRRY